MLGGLRIWDVPGLHEPGFGPFKEVLEMLFVGLFKVALHCPKKSP